MAKAFMIRRTDSRIQNRENAIVNYTYIMIIRAPLYSNNYNNSNLNMSANNKSGQPVDVDITKVTPQ